MLVGKWVNFELVFCVPFLPDKYTKKGVMFVRIDDIICHLVLSP